MPTTLNERITIWRLRHIHSVQPKDICILFPSIPQGSIRRITSTWSPDTLTDSHNIIFPDQPEPFNKPSPKTEIDSHNDKIIYKAEIPLEHTSVHGNRITSLEELVKETDIDLEKWTISRSTIGTWESAMKSADFKPIITTLYKVIAYLIPNSLALDKLIIDALREEIREGIPPPQKLTIAPNNNSKILAEISLPDMHFGKLALEEETGQEYNLDIAERIYKTSIAVLINKILADGVIPEKILFPIGNDLFNVDNAFLTTFAHTPMENTHSVKALFKRVKNILREVILELSHIAPVKVLMIPGNHDRTISYFLAESLEDVFWNNPQIEVINTAGKYQYVSWGKTLIGFTHGDRVQHARLPFLMINDKPKEFANAVWKEWHLGHKHTKTDTDFSTPVSTHKGVIVRELPSLTAADNWHSDAGMKLNNRTAEAYLFDKNTGLIATYNVNLLE